ncbi:MarR family winged helix-turn-helix transcriptional regulator [Leucothrix arctica]|uniref:HTH marR-type domain-containing protein n=1 Tax=Leucothrix arctica TaxID=1481894 RepID=A0A317CBZ5_9GAMM|nr:MarR family winged helix-turn-helix transcriptional regulator [Leucothrix arctica]PWQ94853.1 hypothetical protein DKT75_13960 [Leucothrix arctica]
MTLQNKEKIDNKPMKDSVSFRLNVLTSVINRHAERYLKTHYNIAIPDWRVIAILAGGRQMSVRELSAISKMDKAMVSRVVKRLTSTNAIFSEPDPADGRLLILSIAPAGQELFNRIHPIFLERDERMLATLEEQSSFNESLDRLLKYAENESEYFYSTK